MTTDFVRGFIFFWGVAHGRQYVAARTRDERGRSSPRESGGPFDLPNPPRIAVVFPLSVQEMPGSNSARACGKAVPGTKAHWKFRDLRTDRVKSLLQSPGAASQLKANHFDRLEIASKARLVVLEGLDQVYRPGISTRHTGQSFTCSGGSRGLQRRALEACGFQPCPAYGARVAACKVMLPLASVF